ncbi:MAG: RNA polymerase sigma factor [Bacteroidota bacterium]
MDHRKEFSQLYETCHAPFLRYCSALSFGRMDVEDLVQDVLLSAYRNFSKLKNKDKLLHYLLRAARNRAISMRRKQAKAPGTIDAQARNLMAKGANPEMIYDVQLLYKALDRLPAKQREAVILFEITGFSMREIADLQGQSVAAIKMKVSRGRKKLQQLLTDRASTTNLSHFIQTAQLVLL